MAPPETATGNTAQKNGFFLQHARPVPRVANLDQDRLDGFLAGGRGGRGIPFIVTDATAGWPCMETWSFDWLKDKIGDQIVTTYASIESRVHMKGTLRDYIDFIAQSPATRPASPKGFRYVHPDTGQALDTPPEACDGPQYLVAWNLEDIADLTDDFPQPYFMKGRNLLDLMHPVTRRALLNKHTWMFLGPEGSLSQLHNDHDHIHTYLVQVIGRKHFILFSPADGPLLSDVDYLGHSVGTSRVDPLNPDLKRFPRFYDAEAYECTLERGDLLFIPSSWLHHATGLEAGLTVSKDSVDHHNFGRWFQSMAIDNMPKLMRTVYGHESFARFQHTPAWARRLRNAPGIADWIRRFLTD